MLSSVILTHDYMISLYGVLTNFTDTQKTHQVIYFRTAFLIPLVTLFAIMGFIAYPCTTQGQFDKKAYFIAVIVLCLLLWVPNIWLFVNLGH